MRFCFTVIACFLSVLAQAQANEIALSGGVVTTNNWIKDYKPAIGFAVSAKFIHNKGKHWQHGLGLDIQAINATNTADTGSASGERVKFGAPLAALVLFSNYRQSFGNSYLYGGGVFGFLACNSPEISTTPYESGKGLFLGIQFGGVLGITKNIGLSAEVSTRYNLVSWERRKPAAGTLNEQSNEWKGFFSFPVTVGLHLKI